MNTKPLLSSLLIALALAACMPAALAATGNVTSPTVSGSDIVLSLVNQNPDPASAGDPVELRIGVENQGQSTKQNFAVEVIPSYPFSALQGENLVQTIGALPYSVDQNTQTFKYTLGVDPQANAGTYNVKVWTYTDGNRATHTETSIPVTIQNQRNVQIVYVDKAVLIPGQVTPLTFTISNVGKSSLSHLQFHWSNSDNLVLPVNGGADRYIDSLGIGQSANITYQVIASTNANPDLYGLDLVLSYDNPVSGGQTEFDTKAGIYVGGWTNFSVSFDSSSGDSTSFNIANTGSNPASAVSVSIPDQAGWQVIGSRTSVIGSLAKGDYTIASFSVVGAGRQPLRIEVDYTDTMGNRRVETYDVDMNSVESAGNATGMGGYAGRAGAGGGAGGFAGRAAGAAGSGTFAGRSSGTSATTILLEAVGAIVVIGGIVAGIYAYQRRSQGRKK